MKNFLSTIDHIVALLQEIIGDCEVAYGVNEQSYRQFCESGAIGSVPSDTWARHCQRRKQLIELAILSLSYMRGIKCEAASDRNQPGDSHNE